MDRFDIAALVAGFLQIQHGVGLYLVTDHQRLVLLVALAYPQGVWWLRQIDWTVPPTVWSLIALLMAFGAPVVWVGKLLMEAQ